MADQQYTYCYTFTGHTKKHEPEGFFASSRGTLYKVRYARILHGRVDNEGFIWVTAGGKSAIESFRSSNVAEYDYEVVAFPGNSHILSQYIV